MAKYTQKYSKSKYFCFLSILFFSVQLSSSVAAQTTDRLLQEKRFLELFEVRGFAAILGSNEPPSWNEKSAFKLSEQVDFSIGISPNDWFGTEFTFLHQSSDVVNNEVSFNQEIAEATISVIPPSRSWWLKSGYQFLPFSLYELAETPPLHNIGLEPWETAAVVSPLSFELASKRHKTFLLGGSLGPFLGTIYSYYENGFGFGGSLGYKKFLEGGKELTVNLSVIDNIDVFDSFSRRLEEQEETNIEVQEKPVPGWALAGELNLGKITFSGEYIRAQKRFSPGMIDYGDRGALPVGWTLEGNYALFLLGRAANMSLGYQGTREHSALDLPSSRYLMVFSTYLWKDKLFGTFEWVWQKDYKTNFSGTGKSQEFYTFRLGLEL